MDRRPLSRWILAFFGLTSNLAPAVRKNIFTQIHEIVFHGQGGYDWQTVYNMPIWLRRFTFKKIEEYYVKQNEEAEKQTGQNTTKLVDSKGNVDKEAFRKLTP